MSTTFEVIASFENLFRAFHQAAKGKRRQASVATFERNLETELFQLQDELRSFTYHPGPYRSFYRTEAKRRLISAAPFRDRVVHHALLQPVGERFERRFIFDSYANRVGKGTHRALARCTQFMRYNPYVLACDVRQFFPSIDHALLRQLWQAVVPEEDVLWLTDRILANGMGVLDEMYDMVWFAGDEVFAPQRPRGLPLGNLTSQFWANVYLNPLDQFVKRDLKCRHYLRYVDDLVLFAETKDTLHRWREAVMEYLASLRLTLHENHAQPRPTTEGFPFLGFTVFPDHRRLKRRTGIEFQRRLHDQLSLYRSGQLAFERLNASVQGWIAHAAHGDTWGLRRAVMGSLTIGPAKRHD